MSWVRLWADMPTDPKWRVIAKRSGRPLSEVIAVFVSMMTNAGANATERGVLDSWSDEDVAASLDIETEAVAAIRAAMQGKTLDGDKLRGWKRRQPKREDGSAERAKQWRERTRTHPNAPERPDKDTDTDTERATASAVAPRETAKGAAPPLPEISDLEKLSDRLFDAAGACLSSQAIAPGLASMMVPQMWLDHGADLERDVVPVLQLAAVKRRGISSWDYFTRAVSEAKAKRLAGLPAVDAPAASPFARRRLDLSKLAIVDMPPESRQ